MAQPILEMQGITKRFPGVLALDNVSFDLYPGEVHALLGENGAGKSTLIKILAGDYQKDEGEIFIDSNRVAIENPGQSAHLGVSVIYQELHLIPTLSVAENILLGALPKGRLPGSVNWRKTREQARKVLDNLGVTLDVKARVENLNVAQKQVVEITKSLSRDANIVVMDEPTAALTDREVQGLFRVIKTLTAKGVGIVYISHRLDEVFAIADRVTVMRDGKNVGTQALSEIDRTQVVKMMVGREMKDMYPKREIPVGTELLRVENLSQGKALHDVSLNLHRGEILGIFGLMGAGRTRLSKVLFGETKKDSGRVFIEGRESLIDSPEKGKAAGLGLVPVDRKGEGLLLGQSVQNNITLPNLSAYVKYGFTQQRKERLRAKKWVKELDIRTPSADQMAMNLSGGNQQKVVLAKWLDAGTQVLILNEPTWGVDVGAKVEIYRLLEDLCEQGIGVLMMSSELPEILAVADRILVMREGRITGEFSREEASQESLMRAAIDGIETSDDRAIPEVPGKA